MTQAALTVTQVSIYIKSLLDGDEVLSQLVVSGELSNYKMHSSGHHYFTLKDDGAVIAAVMFSREASKLRFRPENGMKVIIYGRVSLFPKSGQYQIYVTDIQPDGVGALYIAYEQLKQKLQAEGLFDKEHKKPIPQYPRRIALVTSPTGAAVRDMIRVLRSRFPLTDAIVCPVKVQGEGSADDIAQMLDYVNAAGLADLIITGRGGGSIEDLWAFNEELVARAIYRSVIPVISAVGPEPDVTISDFVADLRAATPSNAAELAVRDAGQLSLQLGNVQRLMSQRMASQISARRGKLQLISQKKILSSPFQYFSERRMLLAMLSQQMENAHSRALASRRLTLSRCAASLDALSPLRVLGRGYAMVQDKSGVIKNIKSLKPGDKIDVKLTGGSAKCLVENVVTGENSNG